MSKVVAKSQTSPVHTTMIDGERFFRRSGDYKGISRRVKQKECRGYPDGESFWGYTRVSEKPADLRMQGGGRTSSYIG